MRISARIFSAMRLETGEAHLWRGGFGAPCPAGYGGGSELASGTEVCLTASPLPSPSLPWALPGPFGAAPSIGLPSTPAFITRITPRPWWTGWPTSIESSHGNGTEESRTGTTSTIETETRTTGMRETWRYSPPAEHARHHRRGNPPQLRRCASCGAGLEIRKARRKVRPRVFCSPACAARGREVADWPEDERLRRLVGDLGACSMARELGVSDTAVRKRVRRIQSQDSADGAS